MNHLAVQVSQQHHTTTVTLGTLFLLFPRSPKCKAVKYESSGCTYCLVGNITPTMASYLRNIMPPSFLSFIKPELTYGEVSRLFGNNTKTCNFDYFLPAAWQVVVFFSPNLYLALNPFLVHETKDKQTSFCRNTRMH